HRREHGRLVAGARPDIEHPIARPDAEQLGHPGHDVGLADRLARGDRQRLVRVGEPALSRVEEQLARYRRHRGEDALVADARAAELALHHPGARLGQAPGVVLTARTGHAVEDRTDTPAEHRSIAARAAGSQEGASEPEAAGAAEPDAPAAGDAAGDGDGATEVD